MYLRQKYEDVFTRKIPCEMPAKLIKFGGNWIKHAKLSIELGSSTVLEKGIQIIKV